MQVCKNCGAALKYIATSHDTVIVCNSEPVTVYTESGRKVEGYTIHNCGEGGK